MMTVEKTLLFQVKKKQKILRGQSAAGP